MRIPQEAFAEVEGKTLYRELCWALTEEYGAKPITQLADASWAGKIKIRVPDTPLGVEIQLERKVHEMVFEHLYTEARIKIGPKRWLTLKWKDDKWQWNQGKLFAKIGEEILQVKGEYVAQQSEKREMEANHAAIAAELGIAEKRIIMQSPFVAHVFGGWVDFLLGWNPDSEQGRYVLKDIAFAHKGGYLLDKAEVDQIIGVFNTIGGVKDE